MFQTKAVDKNQNNILCSIIFIENRAVYEVMWKNTIEPGRPQMTIWGMHIAFWIPKVLRLCNVCCFTTATVVA
jgi:hypothetical protein